MARALVFVGLVCLAFTAAGAASAAEETDAVTGRHLLTGQWVWYPTQVQVNGGGNYANNVGTANQQSNNQAVQQYGWGNNGGNVNSQSINTAPDAAKKTPGRKLLTTDEGQWVWYPTQFQANGGGNYANNVGTANQQSNNQAVQQFGGWNVGGNSNSQSITAPTKPGPDPPKGAKGPAGRKLLGSTSPGYWAWYPTQVQINGGGNIAKNAGTVNQQSNNQAVQQAGGWNFGVNSNSQSITTDPPKDPPKSP